MGGVSFPLAQRKPSPLDWCPAIVPAGSAVLTRAGSPWPIRTAWEATQDHLWSGWEYWGGHAPWDSLHLLAWRQWRHSTSDEPADRRGSITTMWQIKVAPSQLTGAISLLIPIKDISCY